MKIKFFSIILLSFCYNIANAQWQNNQELIYDFGTEKGKLNYSEGTNSESTSYGKNKGILPLVKGITSRVTISGGATNGSVELNGDHSLIINQPQKSVVKYSGYDIKSATDVAYFSFNLKFNDFSAEGEYVWAIGNKNGGLFTGIGSVYRSNSGVFAALKWKPKSNNYILETRLGSDESSTTTWKAVSTDAFKINDTYKLEIYCNNSTKEQQYTKEGKNFTLAINQFHVWSNNTLIGDKLPRSVEVSGGDGLTAGKSIALDNREPLNAYLFLANGRPTSDGSASISNIKIVYQADKP
ncbi:hypothetical protein I5M32_14460 [Pedobacter sp. SD-b]|uniref:Polysaccharide lyase n=1 Tax=Pedobacter segetis TaxID=2793069 RepID=A0ABS1BMP2_9SPHI|nr:hypothetical protein [Pedobacter segetis]MBK0384168.1 hypothetical protein [Pedobacter segetis]